MTKRKGIRAANGRMISGRPWRRVDAARRAKFLEVLSETGSVTYAAAMASPHCKSENGGVSSFLDLQKSDPKFAQEVEDAKQHALGEAEKELYRRAVKGWKRPIFQKGVRVGTEKYYSDNLLLRLLQRLNPEWIERHQLEHSGKVQHQHAILAISPADVLLLEQEDQKKLVKLLAEIGRRKEGHEAGQLEDDQEGEQKALPAGPVGDGAKVTDVEPVGEGPGETGEAREMAGGNQDGEIAAPPEPEPPAKPKPGKRRKRGRPRKRAVPTDVVVRGIAEVPEDSRDSAPTAAPPPPAKPRRTEGTDSRPAAPPPAEDAGPTSDELDDLW